jgi:hypothetical protein
MNLVNHAIADSRQWHHVRATIDADDCRVGYLPVSVGILHPADRWLVLCGRPTTNPPPLQTLI